MATLRSLVVIALLGQGVVSCASSPLVLTAVARPLPTCPIGGCGADPSPPVPVSLSRVCPAGKESPCGGASASECTRRAMTAWSEMHDDRAISCLARMLGDACLLGDARGCAFAGRMWIDGRGVDRDVERGIEMLERACDGGVALACAVAVRWLGEPAHARDVKDAPDLRARLEVERACLAREPGDACYEAGRCFYFGRNAFPHDLGRAVEAYERGCNLGDARACNNFGDALAYGEGVERDVARSAAFFQMACRLGEALGCANSGHMYERGEGVGRDLARARDLYRAACATGEVYGCLHAEMLVAEDAGIPRDPQSALAHWRRACAAADARACAFVGILYEDGPDDRTRDTDKSMDAMNRGCRLGNGFACEWVKGRGVEDEAR